MSREKTPLYTVRRDVKCLECGYRGAVQYFGDYYPKGLGEMTQKIFNKREGEPYLSLAVGFGGTIPHECLHCGNIGLIDFCGLEGYKKAFVTLNGEQDLGV